MIQTRFELDNYTTIVLDVVKGKYGLSNRNEALQRMVLEFGSEFVEPSLNEETLIELDNTYEEHMKKHPNRTMTNKELKELLDI